MNFEFMVEASRSALRSPELSSLKEGATELLDDTSTLTCTSKVVRRGVLDGGVLLTFSLSIVSGVLTKVIGDILSQKFSSKGLKITITSSGTLPPEIVAQLRQLLSAEVESND